MYYFLRRPADQLCEIKMKFTISDKKYEKEIKVGQERKEAQEKMLNNQEKESSQYEYDDLEDPNEYLETISRMC